MRGNSLARYLPRYEEMKLLKPKDSAYIASFRVGRLATINENSSAHIVPIVFANDQSNLYFAIDSKKKKTTNLKRIMNIKRTGRATLLFDSYRENWKNLSYLLIYCKASIVEGQEKQRAILMLKQKYKQYSRGKYLRGDAIIVKLAPSKIRRWHADSAQS